MPEYRIYLCDEHGKIGARQSFRAENDEEACEAAALIFDACTDRCSRFEVWDGRRQVMTGAERPGQAQFESLSAQRQESIIDYEEKLRDSAWQISRSRRLIEAIEQAQTVRTRRILAQQKPPPPRIRP